MTKFRVAKYYVVYRFLSFLRNVRKENQRNAVKIDEKVGENKETQKFKEEIN